MDLHTRRKVSLLYLVKGQLINLSKTWLTKSSKGVSGHPVHTSFAGTTEPELYLG